jgi:hypothetical protein
MGEALARVPSSGYEKMRAIAKAMGFPPEAWFDESIGDGTAGGPGHEERGIAGRIEHLFDAVRSSKTGEPYTNAEVARATLGDLSEEDVEGIMTGSIPDPTVGQVAALAAVFGVEPSYVLNRMEPPPLDEELVETLRDDTVRHITRESVRLPDREKRLLLGVARQREPSESWWLTCHSR